MFCPLSSKMTTELNDRSLCHSVGRATLHIQRAGNRSNIDYTRMIGFFQKRKRLLREIKHAEQIDLKKFSVLCFRIFSEFFSNVSANIIHKHIEFAPTVSDLSNDLLSKG